MSTPSTTITAIYRVRSGDTLSHIATRNQLTVAELLALNPQIDNPDRIVIDQPINVPSSSTNSVASSAVVRGSSKIDSDAETDMNIDRDSAKPPHLFADALPTEQSQWPRWYQLARQECAQCTQEIAGEEHNPRIVAYHQCTTLAASDDETPWCSSFVNWCIQTAGGEATRSAAARSWLQWGEVLSQPEEGCVVVLKRGTKPWQGHVGFFVKETDEQICVLGGNQNNCVCERWYPKEDILSYRSITIDNDDAKKQTN